MANQHAQQRSKPAKANHSVYQRCVQKGYAAIQRGDYATAVRHYEKAAGANPASAEAHNDLGGAYRFAWRLEDAIASFMRATELDPDFATAFHNLGITLVDAGRTELGIQALERALELRPGHEDTVLSLAEAMRKAGRKGDVQAVLGEVGAASDTIDAALRDYHLGNLTGAIERLTHLANSAQGDTRLDALRYLGLALVEERRYDEALDAFDRALELDPDSGEIRFYRSLELLRAGNWSEGFAEYEARWRNPHFTSPRGDWKVPEWDGTPDPQATLLLHTEQGYGDSIQFARFIAAARQRVGRVVLRCESPIASLLDTVEGVDQVVEEGREIPRIDCHLPLMSLPARLGIEDEGIRADGAYLPLPPSLHHLPDDPRPSIGLVWAGSRTHANDENRSLSLPQVAPLIDARRRRFVALQKGADSAAVESTGGNGLIDGSDWMTDFEATARLMGELDLVITVDTAAAHLAGALGLPVWLLLPWDADWRWGTEGETTDWYPSMRIFRQSAKGDWKDVIARVDAALNEIFATPTTTPMSAISPGATPEAALLAFRQGVAAHQRNEFDRAVELYTIALDGAPELAEAWNNRGAIRAAQLRIADAESDLHTAIQLNPGYGEAYNNLGIIADARKANDEAVAFFSRAVECDNPRAEWFNNYGNALLKELRLDAALHAYDRALEIDPTYLFAVNNRAVVLRGIGLYDQAIAACHQALEIDPEYHEAINNLGLVLRDMGDRGNAVICFRKVLEMVPTLLDPRINLAVTLQEMGDREASREVARELIGMAPNQPDGYDILGHCDYDEGNLDEAYQWFGRALEVEPNDTNAHWNRALIRLHQGDLKTGLADYDWRKRLASFGKDRRDVTTPHWDGSAETIRGRRIVIYSEQGLGDSLQFIRYARNLKAAGAGEVIFECQKPLLQLLSTVEGVDRTYLRGEPVPDHDLHVYLMSLPALVGVQCDEDCGKEAYIVAPEREITERVRARDGLRVGLVWAGNPGFLRDARRSLHLSMIEQIAEISGVQLFSLQVGAPSEELARSPYADRIIDLGGEIAARGAGMDETAAAMAGMDVVITTCTSVAHLGGALGVPTWVMIQNVPDWRWFLDRTDSPWYGSVRLFRQRAREHWSSVIDEIDSALREQVAAKTGRPVETLRPTRTNAHERTPDSVREFMEAHFRSGDVLVDVESGATIGRSAALLKDREVNAVALSMDGTVSRLITRELADLDLTGTVDVATVSPENLPISRLAYRALRKPDGRVFIASGRFGLVPTILQGASELVEAGRIAGIFWPFRADNQADSIAFDGLEAFGFHHFHVQQTTGGSELFPAVHGETDDCLIFSLSEKFIASVSGEEPAEASEPTPASEPRQHEPQPNRVKAPPMANPNGASRIERAPTPSGAPLTISIDWQVSQQSGWGVYGTNLVLHGVRSGRIDSILRTEPSISGLDPLQHRLMQRVIERSMDPAATVDIEIRGLGNDFLGSGPGLPDSSQIGVVFFENTALSTAALDRARRFGKIIAGSSWNAEVLRANGLDNVELCIQGIDPTVFHPAPRSGWLGDRFVVFSGGKLEYRKGQDIVVAAFREFHRRHPDALLMFAWHNHWPHSMTELPTAGLVEGIPTADAAGNLRFGEWLQRNGLPRGSFIDLGIAPNHQMGRLLREADVALFPNRCEGGTNLVSMEAMASGVPTILSGNTGHLDFARDSDAFVLRDQKPSATTPSFPGVEGWGDSSVEEIVETLEAVYTSPAEAATRALAGSERLQRYSWKNQIDQFLGIVEEFAATTSINR